MDVPRILDRLESHYGAQKPCWPTEPYQYLIWWHCGYPASDAACQRGWESLNEKTGIEPRELLAASTRELASALQPGGMVPDLRTVRLKEIAGGFKATLREICVAAWSGRSKTEVTLTVQLPPTASAAGNVPQVLVCANWPGFAPFRLMLLIVKAAVPVLETVTCCAGEATPTVDAKVSAVGIMLSAGATAVPVS